MFQARLNRLRQRMTEEQVDTIVVYRPENRRYLSGFTGSSGTLVITMDRAYLLTDIRYEEQATAEAPTFEVQRTTGAASTAVTDLVVQVPARRLGFEGNYLTFDEHARLVLNANTVELVGISGLIEGLRRIKDADEQAVMQKAAQIADEGWRDILPLIRPGVAERDLAADLEYKLRKLGGDGPAFDFIVASGSRSSMPHGRASEKLIERGDLVTFDFGTRYQGYCSDMTRTVMVGQPTDQQRQIYEIVLDAQTRGVQACRPGISGHELDQVCRSVIRDRGYGTAFGHSTGHGVGLEIHEGPSVGVRAETDMLETGMVVTIEPGIYLPNWGGVRIEDMVLITESGCVSFSKSPKELLVL